ncbi:hypothetical protein RFI_35763, partial [Reticulomyxa filosa]
DKNQNQNIYHKSLVDSFKSWIIAWIHFDEDKDYAYENFYLIILDRPLNKVMLLHLPNFQYILHHPAIHLHIIDQVKIIQTQFNILDDERLIINQLKLLQYFCISTETSNVVVQCYKQVFKSDFWTFADLLCVISVKLNEQQLDDRYKYLFRMCKINYRNSIEIERETIE